MKLPVISAVICMITFLSFPNTTTPIFAGSNIFTFPSMTGIKTQPVIQKSVFFKTSGLYPNARSLSFSWYLPYHSGEKHGVITIYSLQGKVVTKIPITSHSGTVTWDFTGMRHKSGIYIARISYGVHRQNLKLMLWR